MQSPLRRLPANACDPISHKDEMTYSRTHVRVAVDRNLISLVHARCHAPAARFFPLNCISAKNIEVAVRIFPEQRGSQIQAL
jgi:hypothetical protein